MAGSQAAPTRTLRLAVCLGLTAIGAVALLLLGGLFLGGVLAFWWVAGWSVPLAVLLRSRAQEADGASGREV